MNKWQTGIDCAIHKQNNTLFIEGFGVFGFKPLDNVIEELKRKYGISDEDVAKLEEAIQKYLDYLEEAWEQIEAGEI